MKQRLAHLFLPRHTNKYRAKLVHHSSLLLIVVALLVGNFAFSHIPRQFEEVLGISSSITAQELLVLTNLKREERGLPALTLNNELSQAATAKASDMFSKNYWAHIAPDGTTPWVFIKASGYQYVHAGENLARGFSTSGDVVNAWMDSPGHRDNMLSPHYTEIGFAIQSGSLTGDETVLVVEMLGTRQSGQVAKVNLISTDPTPTPQSVPLTPAPQKIAAVKPSPTPTPTIIQSPAQPVAITRTSPADARSFQVAAATNQPLVNSSSLQRQIAIGLLSILIGVLVLDLIIVQRRKIVRLLSHNIDHLIFFGILLLIVILIGGGGVL